MHSSNDIHLRNEFHSIITHAMQCNLDVVDMRMDDMSLWISCLLTCHVTMDFMSIDMTCHLTMHIM